MELQADLQYKCHKCCTCDSTRVTTCYLESFYVIGLDQIGIIDACNATYLGFRILYFMHWKFRMHPIASVSYTFDCMRVRMFNDFRIISQLGFCVIPMHIYDQYSYPDNTISLHPSSSQSNLYSTPRSYDLYLFNYLHDSLSC